MVKGGRLPSCCRVTEGTICAKSSLMGIILLMTGRTFGWRAFEGQGLVTITTGHTHMRTSEWENALAVIEIGWLPAVGSMASLTLWQLPLMRIVLAMAGRTLRRGPLENAVLVAAFTSDPLMFPCELKCGQVVIEIGWLPGIRGMTGGAIAPKASLMDIIFLMAGDTGNRRGRRGYLEVCCLTRAPMAFGATERSMFAFQGEA